MSPLILAWENSRPSSLPARVASFSRNATRAGSEEGNLERVYKPAGEWAEQNGEGEGVQISTLPGGFSV